MTAWLVRIRPDLRNKSARSDLGDAVRMHQRVMSLAPDSLGDKARQQTGTLHRLDDTPTGPVLIIQMTTKPETISIPDGYGQIEIREIGPLLDALTPGRQVAYRLAANTTKRLSRTAGDREGKVVALTGTDIDAWWTDRAPRCGLALGMGQSHRQDTASGLRQAKDRIRHAITRFDGTATITDSDMLRHAILTGIGRGKSYGCGLLSIALLGQQT